MADAIAAVVAAAVGASLGPPLRSQIFRYAVPAGEPWRTDCPHCGTQLVHTGRPDQPAPGQPGGLGWSRRPRWLAVSRPTGRCPGCAERVGPRTGVVEIVAATVLALLAWRVDDPWSWPALGWIATIGVVLAFVDIAVHRLPDRLTLAAFVGGLGLFGMAALADGRATELRTALVSAVVVGVGYLVLVLVAPAGMGLGDAKAAFTVGLATGWFGWAVAFVGAAAGFVLAGCYATALLIARRAGRKDHIPHGPFLLAGALLAIALTR
ncbi:A24 family peptidase [Solwaraspora sp. WMMD1047]|uniref:prepilin peptidase n=1 Tax=Solwaraspora sp. WMMD1047 TaxID=3016102 RepID=UPI002417FDC0|nr:A24 family peptidase [Solwaraspora sp. WMMD1047]MDG4827843.1 A24 family peptidase [Solwaraspora sp. WMMD1047]